ncbi:MAG: rRNA maturation RNase YbeY [Candidatus Babeliales bacterium]
MSILIKNTQKKIPIDIEHLHTIVTTLLIALDRIDWDISIWITTDTTIKKYNQRYRGKNKATNILSFPFTTYNDTLPYQVKDLGDLILSAARSNIEARKRHIPFEVHLYQLIIHGLCHLIGYDHETDQDYELMHQKETWLYQVIHPLLTSKKQ